jgi:hypothetical protein
MLPIVRDNATNIPIHRRAGLHNDESDVQHLVVVVDVVEPVALRDAIVEVSR